MKVRNEKSYPVFLRYAGKGRAGRNLRAGEVSPECPNDRINLQLVQRHMLSKIIKVYVTKEEKAALKGNISDELLKLLDTGTISCSRKNKAAVPQTPVAPAATAPTDEPPAETPAEPAPTAETEEPPAETAPTDEPPAETPAEEAPADAAPTEETPEVIPDPAPEVSVDCPVVEAEGAAPKIEDQPKSKHLDEAGTEPAPEKTAAELVEDPIKKNAKKPKPAANPAPAKAETADYKKLNKKELLAEIASRGLKKPAATTSTTRLRDKLIKDDESK